MSDGMVFCRSCGGTVHSTAPFCPHCGAPQPGAASTGGGDGIERSFGTSISICLSKYATFAGRAPRAEYWWFGLFQFLIQLVFTVLVTGTGMRELGWISGLVSLALFIPSIAVWVRRLHDVDRSGWWAWIILVPLIGWILILVWACTRGTSGPNRFGPENGLIR